MCQLDFASWIIGCQIKIGGVFCWLDCFCLESGHLATHYVELWSYGGSIAKLRSAR